MTEIEKVKIDILRDALKDASDTVRALDRKIVFLVSYNAIFLGVIYTLFLKYSEVVQIIDNVGFFYCLVGVIGFLWVLSFIGIMMGISPKSNPIEVFNKYDDQGFASNVFFVFTGAKIKSLELDGLMKNYDNINDYKQIEKLLYKEIGKVSYIRDSKLNNVAIGVKRSWVLTFIFIVFITSFGISSLFKNEVELQNTIKESSKQDNILDEKIYTNDENNKDLNAS